MHDAAVTRALFPDEGDSNGTRRGGRTVQGSAFVLVDRAGRTGALSYQIPAGVHVAVGDAVKVPFGKTTRYGLVLGPGDDTRATRPITDVYGKRVTAAELDFAAKVAADHFCDLPQIAARLAPRDGKGAEATDSGPVELVDPTVQHIHEQTRPKRRLLVCAPLVDQTLIAATEAADMAARGQVLILCPTVETVRRTLNHFRSGASRLDADAAPGSWKGFANGTVRIGIGTRVAALYSAHELAGIIVVNEDHPGHRERTQPYTHARDLAVDRSRTFGTELVLTSSAPTAQAFRGPIKAVPVGGNQDWPTLRLFRRNDDPLSRIPDDMRRYLRRHTDFVVVVDANSNWYCSWCNAPRRPSGDPGVALRYDDQTTCTRCGAVNVFQGNWDARRAHIVFGDMPTVTLEQLGEKTGRTIVVPDVDTWLERPSFWTAGTFLRPIVQVCRAAGSDGTVIALTRTDRTELVDVFKRHDLAAVTRMSWERAREEHLPPFVRHVRVLHAHDSAPNCRDWPGRTFGPRRVGKEWEVLVELHAGELGTLHDPLARLRRRGKTRITVE